MKWHHLLASLTLVLSTDHSDAITVRSRRSSSKKLAIAISGGLRGFEHCVQSQVDAFVKPNLDHFDAVDIFVATWDDRGCNPHRALPAEKQPSVDVVTRAYSEAGGKVRDVWLGSHKAYHDWKRIPEIDGQWPYWFKQEMLDNSHDMWILWQAVMSKITPDYQAIIRIRPDSCYSQGYEVQIRQQSDGWVAKLLSPLSFKLQVGPKLLEYTRSDRQSTDVPLEPDIVYMGANMFHRDQSELSTIPDDQMGFGLYKPMESVFGSLSMHVSSGMFNVTDAEYARLYGDPVKETGTDLADHPVALLNPSGAQIRERYPEKVLKHQLLRSGYRYGLIEDSWLSPYYQARPHRSCDDL